MSKGRKVFLVWVAERRRDELPAAEARQPFWPEECSSNGQTICCVGVRAQILAFFVFSGEKEYVIEREFLKIYFGQ